MKVSLEWMNRFVPVDMARPVQELADILTDAGIPVEDVISMNPGKGIKKVYTGKIIQIDKHPDAEKLVVCQLQCINEDGTEEIKQIVTGASNVRVGQIVPVAYHKSQLPDKSIKKGKLRGVDSNGMLCSLSELGISSDLVLPEDAHGIYILPPETPIGEDIKDVLMLNDIVYDFELTANRADCFSMVGLSREFAIMTNQEAKMPIVIVDENGDSIEGKVKIAIEDPELCSRFMARLVTDVKVGPSPLWMQNCLRNSGIRPINNVVDVTNFVMLELGQPMHAYDYDHVKGHTLTARLAKENEIIQTLDGTDRELTTSMLVIADEERPVGVAGVMGGYDSEVSNETTSVLFEAAVFKGVSIRRTARSLGMRSEASGRFERGVNPEFTAIAIDRAAQLLQTICPTCKVSKGIVDVYPNPRTPRTVMFTAAEVNNYVGISVSEERMIEILTKLSFEVKKDGDTLVATIPSWRDDVSVMPDIAEEIARIYGYNNIPNTTPWANLTGGTLSPNKALIKKVNHFLARSGMAQIVTFSFMEKNGLEKLLIPETDRRYVAVPIMNPISEEFPLMRTSLLPSMLEAAGRNLAQKNNDLWLFETGAVYEPKAIPVEELPFERSMACGLMVGKINNHEWGQEQRNTDFYDMKGILEGLLDDLGLTNITLERAVVPYLHPGISGTYKVNGVEVANFGELHPQVAKNYAMPAHTFVFEIDLTKILECERVGVIYEAVSKFPGTSRDLAIVAPKSVESKDIIAIITTNGGAYLENVTLFDVYEGEHVEDGYRSLAYNLSFRSHEGTLTDADIEENITAIIEGLATINCKLR